jgi:RNA polymerase sigma factor (TIGR02999 family)
MADPGGAKRLETTRLLNGLAAGDAAVTEEVVARVQDELRRMAALHMAGQRPGHTLQPTALVNEVWLRLFGQEELHFESRQAFHRFISRVMRTVLIDHARAALADKRGGDRERVSLTLILQDATDTPAPEVDVLELDAALGRLEALDPDLARLIELRFFGGLRHPQIAELLGTSLRTVERQWRLARAWLYAELSGSE